MSAEKRPFRVEVLGTSISIRCEALAIALREAERLAVRMKSEVRVYDGSRLVQTVRPPSPP